MFYLIGELQEEREAKSEILCENYLNFFFNPTLWRLWLVHTYVSLIIFFTLLCLDVHECVMTQMFTLVCANAWPLIFFPFVLLYKQ